MASQRLVFSTVRENLGLVVRRLDSATYRVAIFFKRFKNVQEAIKLLIYGSGN